MIWVWIATVEWYWQGKTEELGEKPVPVPLCPPQIPHGLTRAWTWASAVRGRRLTTWAMPRPTGSYWSSTSVADSPQLPDLPEADQSGWHSGGDAEPLILHVETGRTGGDLRLRWRWRDLYQELLICRRRKFVISYICIWCHSESYYNGPLPPTAGVLLKTSGLFFSWVKIALKRRISAGPCVRLCVDS
jgi:hypothetical protein